MSAPHDSEASLRPHEESSVEAIATLREEHRQSASLYQRTIDAITTRVATPGFIAAITAFIFCWIGANALLAALHLQPFDRPPFSWLQGLVTTCALYVTVLILTTQRHENDLAEHRAQLTLQIALISERKMAKLLERSEQHHRNDPHVETREDPEAAEMSSPIDPRAVSSAIRASQDEAERAAPREK